MARAVVCDPRYRVQHVVIEDVTEDHTETQLHRRHASDAEIRHLANVRMDEPLWEADLDQAVDGALTHPWVRSASAVRRWPDTVVLRVEEHQAVLLLKLRGLYYVDTEGQVFKRARADDLDYPILTGVDPKLADRRGPVAQRVVSEALRVVDAVRTSGELSTDEVSEIRFDADAGFTLVLRNNTELALGYASPSECLSRLHQLREAGVRPHDPQRIDLAPATVAVVTPLEVPPAPVSPGAPSPTSPLSISTP